MTFTVANHRPRDIAIDRTARTVTITWADWHESVYAFEWLRANCPCANCREARWQAAQGSDDLKLTDTAPPSLELDGAELVGGYALQLDWADGHNAGIYTFAALRRSCSCEECNVEGTPRELR